MSDRLAQIRTVLVLNAAAVETLLPMDACIDVMSAALMALSRNEAASPLRTVIRMPAGAIAAMPAYYGATSTAGAKVVTAFPANPASGLASHLGVVLLFDAMNGVLSAIVDATAITAIRTAAVSAVATRALAREDANVLAIVGTGAQAAAHVDAILAVRPIRSVRVVGRDAARAATFIAHMEGRYSSEFIASESVKHAVRDAHVICTVTSSRTPVVQGEWISPGTHVNAVGASVRDVRELDASAVAMSRLYCDSRQSMLAESGDFLFAKAEGAVDDSHIIGELGDVLLGSVPGRTTRDEITLFKSLGLGIEDVAAAHYVHQRAVERGMGVQVPF